MKIKKPVNKKNIDKYFNQYRADAPVEQGGNTPPLQSAKTGHEQTLIQRQIDATDRQIDKLVYELYELTEEEIEIVEGKST